MVPIPIVVFSRWFRSLGPGSMSVAAIHEAWGMFDTLAQSVSKGPCHLSKCPACSMWGLMYISLGSCSALFFFPDLRYFNGRESDDLRNLRIKSNCFMDSWVPWTKVLVSIAQRCRAPGWCLDILDAQHGPRMSSATACYLCWSKVRLDSARWVTGPSRSF